MTIFWAPTLYRICWTWQHQEIKTIFSESFNHSWALNLKSMSFNNHIAYFQVITLEMKDNLPFTTALLFHIGSCVLSSSITSTLWIPEVFINTRS